MPCGNRPFSRRHVFRILLLCAAVVAFTTITAWMWHLSPNRYRGISVPHDYNVPGAKDHPINHLIKTAEATLDYMLAKETKDLAAAAQAYRIRQGRHPPPGFAEWWAFAQDNNATIVEDFFDQIYHDIAPFWGVEAKRVRQLAKHYPTAITVRDGIASMKGDEPLGSQTRVWLETWLEMTATIQQFLPDVDIPINTMDESRVIAPWEDINNYVNAEKALRNLPPRQEVLTNFSGLGGLDAEPGQPIDINWITQGPFWDIARVGCGPDTSGRGIPAENDFSGPPPVPAGLPPGSFEGYVQNWTAVKDPCLEPDIHASHGTFVEPVSKSTSHSLIPIFSGSKLPMNNDILIPAAMYWSETPRFHAPDPYLDEWEKKETRVMWRGGASGGRNRENNWTRFQRHRFVSMTNGTTVRNAEKNPKTPGQGPNFVLQSYQTYHLTATQYMDLGTWLDQFTDVGFVHLVCFPQTGGPKCPYTDDYFQIKEEKTLEEQFGYKFLPDIDGNSFSGRYRSFLKSSSLPIKATIYSEWHDSRLVPWLHFVPMHNSFVDLYGILDYFLGTGVEFRTRTGEIAREGAHDEAAKKIALAGKKWAERVLRKEDMLIYNMRLLLEYARVCDDQREKLGFVDDLSDDGGDLDRAVYR